MGDSVGIGTDNPEAKLHIKGTVRIVADAHEKLRFQLGNSDAGQRTHINFYNEAGDVIDNRITAYAGGGIAFSSTPGSNDQIYFDNGGNVGIGKTSPIGKLDVGDHGIITGVGNLDEASITSLQNSGQVMIGWNRSGGGGEIDFISNRAAGHTGGFRFYDYTNDGTLNLLALIEGDGDIRLYGDTRFGCRSGFWAIGDGRICMEATLRGPHNAHDAIGACKSVGPGSRVCTHTDMQQACGAGYNPYTAAPGWYGDHGVEGGGNWDDEFGTWNGSSCANNNDGPAYSATSQSYRYRCCY
jgi:hypothetical protein